ncbi:hypothetical protein ACFFGF_04705 [Asaia lannensis]|nr:hypothetical protein [Asaia lannensis]GBR01967.1 hypothetical protein AA102526_2674 [Asaia lannensis NBRC 102526]
MSEIEEERALLEQMEGLCHRAALMFERKRLDEKIGPVERPALT